MRLTAEFEQELRRAINPAYEDTKGTESYERKTLLAEIDRLRKQVANSYKETMEATTVANHYSNLCREAIEHSKELADELERVKGICMGVSLVEEDLLTRHKKFLKKT